MGAGYASEGVVSRTAVRRARSERTTSVYPAVYSVLYPLVVHLKIISVRPGRRKSPVRVTHRRLGGAVLVTLWHGLQLAYRPLGPVFNRLLHGAEYVVLNLPGVKDSIGWGSRSLPSLLMTPV